MPAGDRTGPQGMGPRTGRGAGFCAGYDMPGYMNPGFGYRHTRRQFAPWGGYGYRHWYHASGQPSPMRFRGYGWCYPSTPPSPEEEREMLQEQEKWLQEQLEAVRERLAEQESKE